MDIVMNLHVSDLSEVEKKKNFWNVCVCYTNLFSFIYYEAEVYKFI